MKVTYIANSCFLYEFTNGKSLVTDPWFNGPCNQTWFNYPPLEADRVMSVLGKPDYIFISHLHEDHLHQATLRLFDPNTVIVIGKLNTSQLKNKISSFGFQNIFEVPLRKKFQFEGLEFVIFPDFNGNTEGAHVDLKYDLDTSLVVKDRDVVVFNGIDNTILPRDVAEISNFYPHFDMVILPYASASLYPMSIENLTSDQKLEIKEKFKVRYVELFCEIAQKFKSDRFVPAGGEFILGGRSANLANYQPAPDHDFFRPFVNKWSLADKFFPMGPFQGVDLTSQKSFSKTDYAFEKSRDEYAIEISKYVSDFEKIVIPDNLPIPWSRFFRKAKDNYLRKIKEEEIQLNYDIRIIYEDPAMVNQGIFDFSTSEATGNRNRISFRLDYKLLFALLTGLLNWNNIESSCLIKIRREPEEYNTDLHSSMVFFSL